MIGKSCSLPFAYSQIALLIVSLTLVNRPVHAEPNEAPAVLQFARKYQEQQIDIPRQKPAKIPKKAATTVRPSSPPARKPVEQKPTISEIDRQQLIQLRKNITQKEQEIGAKNITIQKLEKKLSQLQHAAKKPSVNPPVATQKDAQMVQKMADSLRNSFSLQPGSDALTEKLKQANKQVSDAKKSEAAMRDQQATLNEQISDLKKQLTTLKDSTTRSASEIQVSLNAQLEKLNAANQKLESDLTDSKVKVSQSSEQVQRLESAIKTLESEKKQYEVDKQRLMQQIAGNDSTVEQLDFVKQQQKKLQDELTSSQQQLVKLENEKQQLKQHLADAPTSAQMTYSQDKVKELQERLDIAAVQQSKERKASEATLAAEKKTADDQITSLQVQLNTAQAQQKTLLTEKQQLEQKLQSDLLGKEQSGSIIAAQLQKLRDDLATAEQQQRAFQAQKEALQQQLNKAPTAEQLADSQLKVKALQSQLDAAILLEKQGNSAIADAKSNSATLLAAKQSAEEKVKSLQGQLDTAQAQQKTLLTEKQRLEQKLQSDLLGKEQNGSIIAAQLQKLRDDLATAEQQQRAAQTQKEALQQQLDKAPTADQLADSQLKVKALQSQLDAAILLEKKGNSALADAKSDSATLLAAKQSAEEKVKSLQEQLDTAQAQQKTLLTEKQQLQQNLQSSLTNKEKNGEAIAAQVKALQDKLATAEKQHYSVQAEKEKLQQQLEQSSASTQQLAESQLKVKALQNQLDTLTLVSQKEKDQNKGAGKVDSVVQEIEKKVAEDKLKALQDKLDSAQAQLAALEKQPPTGGAAAGGVAELTAEKLKKKSTREAYAIGISLGEEILQLQAENRNWASTDSDRPSVLAGIVDSFQGKAKLHPEELQKTLMNVSERVKVGREKFISELDKSTKKFISNFTKDKGTKKSELGFWYRIGYVGDTAIPDGATIDVIVKESLTNGVVIEDMDAKGIVLTQPISAFPPVFREALAKLKNHGSITIVVPPALAYGDKGYPPKVPPNATMVYELRVSDVYAEPKKK